MNLNVKLPSELVKKAKQDKIPIFIHIISLIVYGNPSGIDEFIPITKDTIPNPDNIYGKSKYIGKLELSKLEDDNFKNALIRSPRVYGEKDIDSIQ